MKNQRKNKRSAYTEQTLTRVAGDGTMATAVSKVGGGKRVFGSKAPSTKFGTGANARR